MPMAWRRIAWFASFGAAVLLAVLLRSLDYRLRLAHNSRSSIRRLDHLAILNSQICAAFGLASVQRHIQGADNLAAKIAEATKACPQMKRKSSASASLTKALGKGPVGWRGILHFGQLWLAAF